MDRVNACVVQGRSQEFVSEGDKTGCMESGGGTEDPQRGPGVEPRWGVAPRS